MFLDIAFGIFASKFVSDYFSSDLTLLFLAMSILFVLLPDIDILWYKRYDKIDHRGFMHYPLLYTVVSLALAATVGVEIASLFFVTIMFHFIHDTFILGWGVTWFAPFSLRRYKLFPDNGKGGFLKEKYMTWLPSEQGELEQKLDDKHWIKNWYGKVTVISVVEYCSFSIAILWLVYHFYVSN